MNDPTRPADAQPDMACVRQAAQWLSRLQADSSAATARACLAWRHTRPEHELAWQRISTLAGRFSAAGSGLDAGVAGDAMQRITARESRRQSMKWLLGLTGIAAIAWVADGDDLLRTQLADHRTGTGQRSALTLADGTQLALNTGSAADVRIDATQRTIILRAGEIHIQTAPDPLGRPFQVQTRAGLLTPVGTRFLVRELDGGSVRLSVLEGAVDIRQAGAPVRVPAGQQRRFTADSLSAPQPAGRSAAAWLNGMLVVDHMPLRDFLHELGRYRPGILSCDDALADLPVAGAFSIDDTDATLDLLARTLPLRITQRTRYWVRLLPAQG